MDTPSKKQIALGLAKAIKEGIDKYQKIIKANNDKEQAGLAKLEKTIGQVDPAASGAGTDVSAGSGTVAVPNNWGKGEKPSSKEKDVKKGILPETGSPGTPGGVGDMNNNLDAGFGKGELDTSGIGCPGCGSTTVMMLGALGGNNHLLCSSCGAMGTTPRQENEEAMANEEPTVEKAEYRSVKEGETIKEEDESPRIYYTWMRQSGTQGEKWSNKTHWPYRRKVSANDRAQYEAQKVEKAEDDPKVEKYNDGFLKVPSKTRPGGFDQACPKCKSRKVTMTIQPGGRGSGPGGRWRMGDSGGKEITRCDDCGHIGYRPDKVEKSEDDDFEAPESCQTCGGEVGVLGQLGNRVHLLCRNCGQMSSRENTPEPEQGQMSKGSMSAAGKAADTEQSDKEYIKQKQAKVSGHKEKYEYGHDKAGKAKAFATAWKIHNEKRLNKGTKPFNVRGNPPAISSLRDWSNLADTFEELERNGARDPNKHTSAAQIRQGVKEAKAKYYPSLLNKEEISPRKKVPMTATVEAEAVTGSEVPGDKKAKVIETDGSGNITKGKGLEKASINDYSYGRPTSGKPRPEYDATKDSKVKTLFGPNPKILHPSDKKLGKGAMVDHIKAQSAKAGVDPAQVLKIPRIPKTLPTVKPAPSPNFNKGEVKYNPVKLPWVAGRLTGSLENFQKLADQKPTVNKQATQAAKKDNTRAEYEAQKVEKGEQQWSKMTEEEKKAARDRDSEYERKTYNEDLKQRIKNKPFRVGINKGEKTSVKKTESPASKPIAKSPASGQAAKTSPVKPSKATTKVPKL